MGPGPRAPGPGLGRVQATHTAGSGPAAPHSACSSLYFIIINTGPAFIIINIVGKAFCTAFPKAAANIGIWFSLGVYNILR